MKIIVLGNQAKSVANFWSVLMRRMRGAGHEVICMVPAGDVATEGRLAALGAAPADAPGFPQAPALRIINYPLDRKGFNPLWDAATFASLCKTFLLEKPDLLFASTIKPVIYGCMAAKLTGVKHVYATITGLGYAFEADSRFKRCVNRLGVALYRQALRHVEGVFFQNRDDVAIFRESGILGPQARVLMARGTGVDTRRFAEAPLPPLPAGDTPPEQRRIVFLLVGRLLEAKGLREYAAAARLLKRKYPAAEFRLLGPAEQGLGSVSERLVRQWEGRNGIVYLGQAADVRPQVAEAHVLVLPSWREGTPTAIMEGMSMGRPAVVTDVPGCREVVTEGVNGKLCALRDAESLAAAMEHFILQPQDIAVMGQAGRRLACEEFDATVVARRILSDMRVAQPSAQLDESER
ncbi:glycosyltransferase family 4 protein [uncultured Desulfovibrio sp.]|uniref:glycosyltransferase family 4 protein n=1 Tax=uncultured Desulfovibrio sp. TaxID=167968 RepID=UPI002618DEB1|nr:glycosyltransferase family 4 protein [uncultured Desulfovibrio sp.]